MMSNHVVATNRKKVPLTRPYYLEKGKRSAPCYILIYRHKKRKHVKNTIQIDGVRMSYAPLMNNSHVLVGVPEGVHDVNISCNTYNGAKARDLDVRTSDLKCGQMVFIEIILEHGVVTTLKIKLIKCQLLPCPISRADPVKEEVTTTTTTVVQQPMPMVMPMMVQPQYVVQQPPPVTVIQQPPVSIIGGPAPMQPQGMMYRAPPPSFPQQPMPGSGGAPMMYQPQMPPQQYQQQPQQYQQQPQQYQQQPQQYQQQPQQYQQQPQQYQQQPQQYQQQPQQYPQQAQQHPQPVPRQNRVPGLGQPRLSPNPSFVSEAHNPPINYN